MRVLFITGSFPPMPCGVGDYTALLAGELARRPELEVAVLTSAAAGAGAGAQPERAGLELFPVVGDWSLAELRTVWRVLRAWQPDIVHVQYPTAAFGTRTMPFLLGALARLQRRRTMETWHEPRPIGTWRNVHDIVLGGDIVLVRPDILPRLPRWYRAILWRKRFHVLPIASNLRGVTLSGEEREAVRARYAAPDRRLIAHFGFASAHKGSAQLFDIAEPARDHLVFVGPRDDADPYQREMLRRASTAPWAGHVTFTGFVPPETAARLLAAADAVVLPFRDGSGSNNGSLLAAAAQGTYVVTTARDRHGYVAEDHAYFARPGDVGEMRAALTERLGERRPGAAPAPDRAWREIADAHVALYRRVIASR